MNVMPAVSKDRTNLTNPTAVSEKNFVSGEENH